MGARKKNTVILLITFLIFTFLSGCSLFFKDTAEPVPSSRVIEIKELKTKQITVSWEQAADDKTPEEKIIYSLFYSTKSDMQVLEDVLSSTVAVKGTSGDLSETAGGKMTATITGLVPVNAYSINVTAEDTAGNRAVYLQITIPSREYNDTFSGGSYEIFKHGTVNESVESEVACNIDIGSSVKDLYFIFSNKDHYSDSNKPSIQPEGSVSEERILSGSPLYGISASLTEEQPAAYRGRPDVTEFNNSPIIKKTAVQKSLSGYYQNPVTAVSDSVNDTKIFYDLDSSNNPVYIPATCRLVFKDSGGTEKTLNIWVADDSWETGGTKANLITQIMLDTIAGSFLKTGAANDIYDWVTTIFGAEWGAHTYADLIQPDNNITILLYDIGNDNSTSGGVMGFFWAKDNYIKTSGTNPILDYSNERIMFYIDSMLFAEADPGDTNNDGSDWDPDDYWPKETISALAHEFQHMIHFYQHGIVYGADTETWINELCSLATEDIVSDKLGVAGPRGVDPADGSAGSPGLSGRLNRYNYKNYLNVTNWLSGNDVLYSYSLAYSFGAFLIRNFGGAVFLKNTVQNSENYGWDMISYALKAAGDQSGSMDDRLADWASAVLLSDYTGLPENYRLNTGTWFSSVTGGITYNLGSINLYNYSFADTTGPVVFNSANYGSISSLEANSGTIYNAGKSLAGKNKFLITIPKNTGFTVIVRESR
ncbi:MAG: peptidase M30 [Spirochaetes bacterium]|nr:peptidase M30 [Spirochaetota bacterium]